MSTDADRTILEGLFGGAAIVLSATAEYELRTDDYIMEMPQSGERIVGRDNIRAFQEAYPNPPRMEVRRIIGEGDLFSSRAGPTTAPRCHTSPTSSNFATGAFARTRYYATPFEPPPWRPQWVDLDPEKKMARNTASPHRPHVLEPRPPTPTTPPNPQPALPGTGPPPPASRWLGARADGRPPMSHLIRMLMTMRQTP